MPQDPVFVPEEEQESFDADDAMTIHNCVTRNEAEYTSFVIGELNGYHGRFVNERSEKLYYVLSGSVEMNLDGDTYTLETGDTLLIPPHVPHSMEGTARMAITTGPPFNPADEEQLDPETAE